jgi:predicted phage baseplate assembly protein
LQVRVNNLLWTEVSSLINQGPTDRVYITRIDNVGNTSVIFGDGTTGSRLPTGQSNVTATYRIGIGLGGQVKANQLSQLMTRPLGVKAAVNPIAADGAADPEVLEDARSNATLTILTLDRIVSLQDFEDYTRAFPGIGKSLATATWNGQKNGVFVTVAGANGDPVGDILSGNLLTSIIDNGDPNIPVSVASYQQKFFQVEGSIQVDSTYITDDVIANVESQLRSVFSFTERAFGQPVFYSEVIEVMQNVDGVIAVDVDYLYRSDQSRSLNYTLVANLPIASSASPIAAELLTIDPRPIILNTIT